MNWWDIIKVAASAGVLSAILNQGFAVLIQHSREKKSAAYLALRVAIILETFASECARKIRALEYDDIQGIYDAGFPLTGETLPQIAEYPDDDSWKHMPSDLASEALSFPNLIEQRRQAHSNWMDTIEAQQEGFSEKLKDIKQMYGDLGMHSMKIAYDLRKKHRLPKLASEGEMTDFFESYS